MEAFLVPSPQAEVLDSHLFCLSLVLNSFLGLCFGKKRKVALTVSKSTVMCLRLLYADDLLNAKENEARAIRRCFEQYFSWSGQEANIEKSCILFSKNTSKLDRMAIKVVFGFKEMAKDSVYFGNTLLLSRNKMKDFKIMKDRIGQRIEGWNQNLRLKTGKLLSFSRSSKTSQLTQCLPSGFLTGFAMILMPWFIDSGGVIKKDRIDS